MRDIHKEFDDDFEKANKPVKIESVVALTTAGYIGATCQDCGKTGEECSGCGFKGMMGVFEETVEALKNSRKGAPAIPVAKQVTYIPSLVAVVLNWYFIDNCKACESSKDFDDCKACICRDLRAIWSDIVSKNKIGRSAQAATGAKKPVRKSKAKTPRKTRSRT